MPNWSFISAVPLLVAGLLHSSSHADRRTVDQVSAGNAQSELSHGFAEHASTWGVDERGSYRETTGWIHYALATFEDTEVTLRMVFSGDSIARQYNVVVQDSVIASGTITNDQLKQVDFPVPFVLTKGRSFISVTVQAHSGGSSTPTPKLRLIQTVQEHNEFATSVTADITAGSLFTSTRNSR